MASPMTFGPRTTTIALWWQPTKPSLLVLVVLLLFLITLRPSAAAFDAVEATTRRHAPQSNHCFFFVSSLALTVTIVPKICRSPRPTRSSAQPVRANCVKGLASRCDLRVLQ